MIRPARVYGAGQRLKKHNGDTLAIFELARLWDPSSGTPPSRQTLQTLIAAARLGHVRGQWALPQDWLPAEDIERLVAELPVHITQVDNHLRVGQIKDVVGWWRGRRELLPTWSKYAFKLALLKPASAGIERVWSVFTRFFKADDIKDALMDYIEAVLLVNYNYRSKESDSRVPAEINPP